LTRYEGERLCGDLELRGPHAVSDGETGAERGPAINAGGRPAVLATVFLRHPGAEFPWSVLDFAGEPGVQGHLRDRGALADRWLAGDLSGALFEGVFDGGRSRHALILESNARQRQDASVGERVQAVGRDEDVALQSPDHVLD